MLITRIKAPLFLCGVMLLWSVISIATAFSGGFVGLLLTRFFLGVVEAPYYVGRFYASMSPTLAHFLASPALCTSYPNFTREQKLLLAFQSCTQEISWLLHSLASSLLESSSWMASEDSLL